MDNQTVLIRKAVIEDASRFLEIHNASIREICASDYSPDQIEAWATFRTAEDFRYRITKDVSYVAEVDGNVVGYVRFSPRTNELCSLHVHPSHARLGIGTALIRHAISDARRRKMSHFWLHSSLTAVPFYESLNFVREVDTTHMFGDIGLQCVAMKISFGDHWDRENE
jgi:putative acetyltransferase